ncbi:MAG: tetratricopeptide repeat protein [Proteobacteria bacterium]|nr:tetratricopeptide repeat protein [Pseudomonadota bacterium]
MNTVWRLVGAFGVALGLAACAGPETDASSSAGDTGIKASGVGAYLAARHAERIRAQRPAAQFMLDALQESPENFDLLNRAHVLLITDGRFGDAVDIAERILRINATHPPANLTVAFASVQKGDYAAAETRLRGLAYVGVNRVVLPLMLAWLNVAQVRPAAALNALRSLNEVSGFQPFYHYHAALIDDLVGWTEEAAESYRRATDVEGGAPIRLIEAAGEFLERQGRREEARAIYARVLEQSPDSIAAAVALARTIGGAPPPRQVQDAVTGIAEALFNIAGALRQENNGQLSLTYARLALALKPDLPVAIFLVADILDRQGQTPEANAMYARIAPDTSLGWSARLRIAENLHTMGDSNEAIRRLSAMANERTDRIDALLTLGQLLRIKERFVEAVQTYDRAVGRIPAIEQRYWPLLYARGIALERAKMWPRAEADFLKALELQPDQPDVLNYLAYSWVDQGMHFERARRMLDRAVELRPNSGQIVDSLGWVLYRTGKHEEAVRILERAVELVPEDPVILGHLGDAYWRVGRINEARFQWRRALGNKPEPDQRAELERKLRDGLKIPGSAASGG